MVSAQMPIHTCTVLTLLTAGQMEYASKQLLCAVHMRGGPKVPSGLLVSLDEMNSRYWSDSAAGVVTL